MKKLSFFSFILFSCNVLAANLQWNNVGSSTVTTYSNIGNAYIGTNGTTYYKQDNIYKGNNGVSINHYDENHAIINRADGTTSSCSKVYSQWVCN